MDKVLSNLVRFDLPKKDDTKIKSHRKWNRKQINNGENLWHQILERSKIAKHLDRLMKIKENKNYQN